MEQCNFQNVESSFAAYKQFQLLQNFINQSIGNSCMIPATSFSFLLLSFGIFTIISYHHVLDLPALVFLFGIIYACLFFTACTFTLGSRVSMKSSQILLTPRSVALGRFQHLQLKSLVPLSMDVGGFFHIKSYTILGYYSIVLNNVITLVCSFG